MLQKISIKDLQHLRNCSYSTAQKEYRKILLSIKKDYLTVVAMAKFENISVQDLLQELKFNNNK